MKQDTKSSSFFATSYIALQGGLISGKTFFFPDISWWWIMSPTIYLLFLLSVAAVMISVIDDYISTVFAQLAANAELTGGEGETDYEKEERVRRQSSLDKDR